MALRVIHGEKLRLVGGTDVLRTDLRRSVRCSSADDILFKAEHEAAEALDEAYRIMGERVDAGKPAADDAILRRFRAIAQALELAADNYEFEIERGAS
jgi:hypothetical protein